MSVIAFKVSENKIQVASDGICISDDKIVTNNFKKIIKVSDSLIIGVTGVADTTGIFEKFVRSNSFAFEHSDNVTDLLPLFKRFKDYISSNFGYSDETIKEFGGFLVANKVFHGVFYYDANLSPYCTKEYEDIGAFGSTGIYTSALLDCGIGLEEAIKKSAEKFTSINDNVTVLEISR